MNENEIKAKFFALYLGQPCYRVANETIHAMLPPDLVTGRVIEVIADGKYPDAILILRSIADLTDGEMKQVADVCDMIPLDEMIVDRTEHFAKVYSKFSEDAYPDHVAIYYTGDVFMWHNCVAVTIDLERAFIIQDYLRSIGVLLPFTYLNFENEPITLTPSQLIEKGWCQYKEK